jgi:translation initiation factor 3 subunit C
MRDAIQKISNAKKNSDWSIIQDKFEETNKMIEKSRMLILKNGIPKFYIKMLAEVEDFVTESLKDKDAIKNLKPGPKKAFERMKLTVKKHNKQYETEITDFRQHPEKYEDEKDEESDSSDEDDSESEEDSDEDSDKSESESEAESESSEEDLLAKPKAKPVKTKVLFYSHLKSLFILCV